MDYFSDQKGIIRRFINEEGAWKNHLTNTKNYITECLKDKKLKSVAILGSGWLLDVPLEFLINNFEKIILFDINHPKQIKHKVRKFENIELICEDISGGAIRSVYNLVKIYKSEKYKTDIKEIVCPGFKPDEQPEYIISLNIINQLDILLVDYLKKHSIYNENELNCLRSRVQKSHIDSLIPGKSCLITDYEEIIYNADMTLSSRKNLIFTELPEGKNKKSWKWNFDLSGSYHHDKKVIFNVLAMEL
ncbi:MAG: hypothetical protein JSV22_02895 [Bacteroidales bacterium]|nr:MAG: hypothetical protein JSV22_02895 [Bacteroidales bacterium]